MAGAQRNRQDDELFGHIRANMRILFVVTNAVADRLGTDGAAFKQQIIDNLESAIRAEKEQRRMERGTGGGGQMHDSDAFLEALDVFINKIA